ncbi:peptidylprolyl isomerase [Teredinibacter waterburyi]|jgi:Parvulin-like peptidyl-prolyl isomerase|uniref:peptidylprolyl isomerase n=1 Tax=Teredinibacter waterburyi TaxID=1500538 RepID=UPI00165FBE8E|nr:peptidylprolyl isomerase [Teredinibacter waterburyi]
MHSFKHLLAALSLSTLLASNLVAAQPEMLDRIIAIIDQAVITQTQLDNRTADIAVRAAKAGMRLPEEDILKKQILDQLIAETLQINMAKRYGIEVPDADVNNSVANIASERGWDKPTLIAELAKDGLTLNEFRERMRREILISNISQGVVRGRIRISDQEITNFLKSADAQFWISPDYHLGHILISLPPSPSKEEVSTAEAKAKRIYEQLSAGGNFAETAIAESSGPAALQGGDLGFRKTSQLPTLFAEIAPTLEVGQVAAPARSQAGFHILKLYEKRGETKQIVAQVHARHILIKPSAILTNEKAKAKLEKMRTQILNGEANFDELAKDHSEDIGSKMGGGDLGWAQPDTFVPEFSNVINKTKVGELSEVFKSQFGWHLLEVIERRDEDLTEEAIRAKARQMLTNRRFEDETQIWLQEMRDDAFIEIKI